MSTCDTLDIVSSQVLVCTKCPLWKSRKKAVPGVGSPRSRLMLVGEAPGSSEDTKGEPFVGAAGRFLDTLLSHIGFSRKQVFITNVVKCRPPRNREPKPFEIETCAPYLDRQIQIIRPKFIVSLGSHSTSYIFSRAAVPFISITQTRGISYRTTLLDMQVTLFATFHPASTLYSPRYKEIVEHDFQKLEKEISQKTARESTAI